MIDVTRCRILNVREIPGAYPEEDEEVAATYLRINNGDNGSILMVFSRKMLFWLAGLILKRHVDPDVGMDEEVRSILAEIGNICTCSYLNALSMLLEVTLIPSPPSLAVDLLPAILQFPACTIGEVSKLAIIIETEFIHRNDASTGLILFLPDKQLETMILSRFGIIPDGIEDHV